jgi:hypothetical protein
MPDQRVGYLRPRPQITMPRWEQFGRGPEHADPKNPAFDANDTFNGAFLGLGRAARFGPFARHEWAGRNQQCQQAKVA